MRIACIFVTLLAASNQHAAGAGITYIFGAIYDSQSAELITLDAPDLDVRIDGRLPSTISQGTYVDPLGVNGFIIDEVTAAAPGYFTGSATNINIVAGGMHQEDFYLVRDPAYHSRTITISFADQPPGSTAALTPQTRSWYATTSDAESAHIFELLPPDESVSIGLQVLAAAN